MPIYEYRCGACGFQKEYLQKMSAALLTDCPECGKPSLTKMVTAAGFQLKGSGWYATDFKNGAKPKPKTEDQPAAKAGSEPAAKAEDKSAAQPESKSVPETPVKKTEPAAAAATTGGGSPANT